MPPGFGEGAEVTYRIVDNRHNMHNIPGSRDLLIEAWPGGYQSNISRVPQPLTAVGAN